MESAEKNLSALRRSLAALDPSRHAPRGDFSFGLPAVDGVLGGLPRGALHEVYAAQANDAASAAGFALALALRIAGSHGKIVWLRHKRAALEHGALHARGLLELGARPVNILLVDAHDPAGVLRAASDTARSRAVAAVVVELSGESKAISLNATRRLSFAAGGSGVTVLLLRTAALPCASAAHTRWSVRAASSSALAANAPGHPVFEINLLRHRRGIPGRRWRVQWSRDAYCFREPPLSRAVASVPVHRPHAVDEGGSVSRRAG
jgi:protein ImuA